MYFRPTQRKKQVSAWGMREGFVKEGGMVSKSVKTPGAGGRAETSLLNTGVAACDIGS